MGFRGVTAASKTAANCIAIQTTNQAGINSLDSVTSVALTMLSQDNSRVSKSINFTDEKRGICGPSKRR